MFVDVRDAHNVHLIAFVALRVVDVVRIDFEIVAVATDAKKKLTNKMKRLNVLNVKTQQFFMSS